MGLLASRNEEERERERESARAREREKRARESFDGKMLDATRSALAWRTCCVLGLAAVAWRGRASALPFRGPHSTLERERRWGGEADGEEEGGEDRCFDWMSVASSCPS